MWARMKTRGISIDIEGAIPGTILEILRLEYGPRLRVTADGFERMRDVLNAPLYKQETLEMSPGGYLRFFRPKFHPEIIDIFLRIKELHDFLGL